MPSAAKMAEMKAAICVAAVVVTLIHVATAADYIVGDPTGGWQGKTDYKSWASAQTFAPGDTLTFKYSLNHNVVEVTADDYVTCSTANPVSFDNSGITIISLTAPGKRYFICGGPGHCQNGMKVEVDVADRPAPTAPSSPPQLPPLPPAPTTLSPTPAPAAEPPRHAGHKKPKKWHCPPKPAPTMAPGVQSSAEGFLPVAAVAPMSSTPPPPPMSSHAVAVWHAKWGDATLGLVALWFAVLAL